MDIPEWTGRLRRKTTAAYKKRCQEIGARCWLCEQPIDYTAPPGTTNAFELDHFYPRADYPELTWEETNFRPAHASCNRARGKRDAPTALGPTTIDW